MDQDRQYHALVDHAPSFIAVLQDGRFVFANQAAVSLLGLKETKELIGEPLIRFVEEDNRSFFEQGLSALIDSRAFMPATLLRVDNQPVFIELGAHSISFEGRDDSILLVARDTTDLHYAAEAVRTREERLKMMLDTVVDAIVTINENGTIEKFNKSAEKMFGYRAGEVIGRNVSILMPEPMASEHDDHIRRYLETREAHVIGIGRETTARRKDGSIFPIELALSEFQFQGKSLFTGVLRDITERKRAEQQLRFLAHHDPLTGLPNRTLLTMFLESRLAESGSKKQRFALVGVDLDRFKNVNDLFGHAFGDRLLQLVANRIEDEMRESDFLSRPGGDEFVAVVDTTEDPGYEMVLAEQILTRLPEPLNVGNYELFISGSIGIVTYPNGGAKPLDLLKNLETTTYFAKERGRNNIQVFSASIGERYAEMLKMETDLRRSIETGGFQLYYQPKVDLRTGHLLGAEALLRWRHDDYTFVSPAKFVPVAEETGLIVELGEWVLQEGCRATQGWNKAGFPDLKIAVNLSPRQFRDSALIDRIAGVLRRTGLNPANLELEITESGLMDEVDNVLTLLDRLKGLGVTVAIDDFGTGYSSLSYLKRFPLDVLKIDKSFVNGLPGDQGNIAISTAIIAMAKSLHLKIVAEGVETEEQRKFLVDYGCDIGQGYLFGKPMSWDDFDLLVRDHGGDDSPSLLPLVSQASVV